MQAQLQQIIEVQAEQNRLLKTQLRWLKATLALLLLVTVCCVGSLIQERGIANGKITVVTTEPILEHPISLAESDTAPEASTEKLPIENETIQFQFGKRITVPPMSAPAPIQLDFSFVIAEAAGDRPRRGCDGMCF